MLLYASGNCIALCLLGFKSSLSENETLIDSSDNIACRFSVKSLITAHADHITSLRWTQCINISSISQSRFVPMDAGQSCIDTIWPSFLISSSSDTTASIWYATGTISDYSLHLLARLIGHDESVTIMDSLFIPFGDSSQPAIPQGVLLIATASLDSTLRFFFVIYPLFQYFILS